MENKIIILAILGLLIVGLMPAVSALGIIQDVDDFSDVDNRMITLTTKETYTSHNIRIPNNDDTVRTIKFTLKSGEEVASIKDIKEEYTIPPKTKLELTFDINIPEEAEPGDEWNVVFEVLELQTGTGAEATGAMLTQSVTDNFRVELEKAPASYTWLLWLGGGLILLFIIIAIAMKKSSGGY